MEALLVTCYILFTSPPPHSTTGEEMFPSPSLEVGMERAKHRAAELWGSSPGLIFDIHCIGPDGQAHEVSTAGGGHPALGFHNE